jgi:hypothetical protein
MAMIFFKIYNYVGVWKGLGQRPIVIFYEYCHDPLWEGIGFSDWFPLWETVSFWKLPEHFSNKEYKQAQYILSVSLFVIANKELFTFNSQVHNYSTRTNYDLHYPQTNSAQFQKGICYIGIKIFNHLPTNIKCRLNDFISFKLQLTTFLL